MAKDKSAKKAAKKQKKATKRAAKKVFKTEKKEAKKTFKTAKKEIKQQKKEQKKAKKEAKKQMKQQTTVDYDAPVTEDFFDGAAETAESATSLVVAANDATKKKEKKGKLKNFFNNIKDKAKNLIPNVAKNVDSDNVDNNNNDKNDMDSGANDNKGVTSTSSEEETFLQKHGTKLMIGGGLVIVGTALYFLLRDKNDTPKSEKNGVGYIEPIDLS